MVDVHKKLEDEKRRIEDEKNKMEEELKRLDERKKAGDASSERRAALSTLHSSRSVTSRGEAHKQTSRLPRFNEEDQRSM
jgi:Skp family chaperone for outer membrane proteins